MNILSLAESQYYWEKFNKEFEEKKYSDTDIILCPPFIFLCDFLEKLPKGLYAGAQDGFYESQGAYTGAVSLAMLKNLGLKAVILGHSERRKYFSETDQLINKKVQEALKQKLMPIICIGETENERESGLAFSVIEKALRECLKEVSRAQLENIIIAYEPIWAVGTDKTPNANDILGAKVLIRKVLTEIYGVKYAQIPKIIYGGSVNKKNVKEVCLDSSMDGALLGRPSLEPKELLAIAELINDK